MAFIEPCFGIGHNLSLMCQMTSEDIKHQLIRWWGRERERERERESTLNQYTHSHTSSKSIKCNVWDEWAKKIVRFEQTRLKWTTESKNHA